MINHDGNDGNTDDDDGHSGHQHHCPRLPHPDRELPPAGVDRPLPLQLRLRLPDLQDEEGDAGDDQVRDDDSNDDNDDDDDDQSRVQQC